MCAKSPTSPGPTSAHAAAKRTNLLALDDTPTEAEALFCFVSYLMAYRDEGSTFWYGDLYRAESMRWYAFYEAKLGAPVAAMAEASTAGVFVRRFERGVVLVNAGDLEQRVMLPDATAGSEGQGVSEVILAAKEGRILLSE